MLFTSHTSPHTHRVARLITATALAVSVVVAGVLVPSGEANAASDSVAQDQFDRTTKGTWGSATAGGAWSSVNPSVLGTASGAGVFRLKPSSFAVNTLKAAPLRDASVAFSFWASMLPKSGNGVTTSAVLRAADGYSYQARARLLSSGRIAMTLSRYDGRTSKETVLVADTIVLRNASVTDRYTIEFTATGDAAVALSARLWKTGTTAPDWQLRYTDRSAQRIVRAGASGVGAYLSAATPALDLWVDDFAAGPAKAPSPAPTPTPAPNPAPAPNPVPAPNPAPAPNPNPAPNPAPGPVTPPASSAGSAKVGTTAYPVPANAVFVTADGPSRGTGTKTSPYGSLTRAVAKAPAGSTLVLRGGNYHESVTIPIGKKLTIQSYPGEAVWLDGSSAVSGWKKSGSVWAVSAWNHAFDRRVSFNKNSDETSRWTDATNPYAGYPDQVWIDGTALRQVGSAAQVTAGTFFVDTAGKRLVIGSDPSGKSVRASTLQKALTIGGAGSTVRGIGVRHYATTVHQMGAVTAEVPKITLENLVITRNSTIGLYAWAADHTFRNLTVTENGLMGIGANKADRLTVTDSLITGNNTERFKPAPVSGGMKITASNDVVIRGNDISRNTTAGLWFDMSAYNTTIVGNTIDGNGRYGLLYEASEKAVISDNLFTNAGHTALMIHNSGNVQVWNNTFAANDRTLWVMQDERRQDDRALATKIPWIVKNVTLKNNVISYGTGTCPILTQDLTEAWDGNDFGMTLDSNVYHRASSTSPSNFACWANGSAGTRSFKTLEDFRAHTGGDKKSRLLEGASPLTSTFQLTAAALKLTGSVASPVPTSIVSRAGAITGLPLGQVSLLR